MIPDKRTTFVSIHGKQYPLCLTVAANEKLNDTYGGMKNLIAGVKNDSQKAASSYVGLLHILLEGGANRQKALAWISGAAAEVEPVPDLETLQDLLSIADVAEYKGAILEALAVSSMATVETEPDESKNADTTQGSP